MRSWTLRLGIAAAVWAVGAAALWQRLPPAPRAGWQPPENERAIGFLSDSRTLVCVMQVDVEAQEVRLRDVDTGEQVGGFVAQGCSRVEMTPARDLLIAGNHGETWQLIDAHSGAVRGTFDERSANNAMLVVSPDGRHALLTDANRGHGGSKTSAWVDLAAKNLTRIPRSNNAIFSPDSRWLAAVSNESPVIDIVSTVTGLRQSVPHERGIPAFFTADSARLSCATGEVWALSSGGTTWTRVGSHAATAVGFATDGGLLIVRETNKNWRLARLDPATGNEVAAHHLGSGVWDSWWADPANDAVGDWLFFHGSCHSESGFDAVFRWQPHYSSIGYSTGQQHTWIAHRATGKAYPIGNGDLVAVSSDGKLALLRNRPDTILWDLPPRPSWRQACQRWGWWALAVVAVAYWPTWRWMLGRACGALVAGFRLLRLSDRAARRAASWSMGAALAWWCVPPTPHELWSADPDERFHAVDSVHGRVLTETFTPQSDRNVDGVLQDPLRCRDLATGVVRWSRQGAKHAFGKPRALPGVGRFIVPRYLAEKVGQTQVFSGTAWELLDSATGENHSKLPIDSWMVPGGGDWVFSADGRFAVCGLPEDDDVGWSVLDVATGRRLYSLPGIDLADAVSLDGRWLLGAKDEKPAVVSLPPGTPYPGRLPESWHDGVPPQTFPAGEWLFNGRLSWHLTDGTAHAILPSANETGLFTADGQRALAAVGSPWAPRVMAIDPAKGFEVAAEAIPSTAEDRNPAYRLTFLAPGDRWLAVHRQDGSLPNAPWQEWAADHLSPSWAEPVLEKPLDRTWVVDRATGRVVEDLPGTLVGATEDGRFIVGEQVVWELPARRSPLHGAIALAVWTAVWALGRWIGRLGRPAGTILK